MFRDPELAGKGIETGPLRIAVTVAPYRSFRSGSVDKRVVSRDGTVIIQPVDFAVVVVKFLREVEVLSAVSDAEEDVSFTVKGYLAAEVIITVSGRFSGE